MKQKDIVAKIRKLGYKVTVLSSSVMNRAGIPDILVSIDGEPIFIEIKIDKDKLSKLQEHFANEFKMSWCCLHYSTKHKEYILMYMDGFDDSSVYLAACAIRDKLNGAV